MTAGTCGRLAGPGGIDACETMWIENPGGGRHRPRRGDHLWRGALMQDRTCEAAGCERPRRAQKLCTLHYQRAKRDDPQTPRCVADGCAKPRLAQGYCTGHYSRWKSTGSIGSAEIKTRRGPDALCEYPGCEKKHFAHGYCNTHRKRQLVRGTLEIQPRVRATCSFDHCGRAAAGSGLCTGHYQQQIKGVELAPLRRNQPSVLRDGEGRKNCSTCRRWLAVSEFYPSPKAKDGLNSYCKRCDRSQRLTRNYGITVTEYDLMLEAQGGGCAICGGLPKDGPSFHVDHDHSCCPDRKKSCGGCVRGLLCEDCNRVLGMFGDSALRFERAIGYLKKGARS